MARYFELGHTFIREYDEKECSDYDMCRTWDDNDSLAVVRVRYGRGQGFEPYSSVPRQFRLRVKDFVRKFPKPQINTQFYIRKFRAEDFDFLYPQKLDKFHADEQRMSERSHPY